jgi:hypothetical protein
MLRSTIAVFLLMAGLACAQAEHRWQPLDFMIGKWKAETGSFTLLPELNGQVLVRRNFNNTPGQKHEDLMIVYSEGGLRAVDFDTEGHVIHYKLSFPAKDAAVFDSEGPGPKYRLSYVLDGAKLNGKFEVDGKTYLTWTTVKE